MSGLSSTSEEDGVIFWPQWRSCVTMLCFYILSLSHPFITCPIPPLLSSSLCHQPCFWVMSHDTHAEIPSISHSDIPLPTWAGVCVHEKERPWVQAWVWDFKGGQERGRMNAACIYKWACQQCFTVERQAWGSNQIQDWITVTVNNTCISYSWLLVHFMNTLRDDRTVQGYNCQLLFS